MRGNRSRDQGSPRRAHRKPPDRVRLRSPAKATELTETTEATGRHRAVRARSLPRERRPRGSSSGPTRARDRTRPSPEAPQAGPKPAGRPGTTSEPGKPPTGASAPGTAYRCPPGRRRMKYATATCHTGHSPAGLRTGSQPQGTGPPAPPAERTRAAFRALVVQRRPRPQESQRLQEQRQQVTHCPSVPSSCCLSSARQAAASRHASAPAREGIPEAPEGSRPRSGTVDSRTPRRYFCTPSARSPNSTASTPHYPLVELVFDYGISCSGWVRRFRRRSRGSPPDSPVRVG